MNQVGLKTIHQKQEKHLQEKTWGGRLAGESAENHACTCTLKWASDEKEVPVEPARQSLPVKNIPGEGGIREGFIERPLGVLRSEVTRPSLRNLLNRVKIRRPFYLLYSQAARP